MVMDFFSNEYKVSILFIGEMAYDEILIQETKKLPHSLYMAKSAEEILSICAHYNIDYVFGTVACADQCYLEILKKTKILYPNLEMVLFSDLRNDECFSVVRILAPGQNFCIETQRKYAFDYLKNGLKIMAWKKVLLKGMQYFDSLIDSSIVSQTDINGNITYINANFTKVTGYTKEEILGKNHRILKHPSTPLTVYTTMWDTIIQGHIWRERVLNINKDGSDFWADTIIIPYKNKNTGKIEEYIAIRRDITQMLEERRAIQAREIQANEQIKLTEAKDAFLILFTHELKTPLNAIINFSQYLYKNMNRIEEIPKEKRMHLLGQIYKSASMMLDNVTHILDLSKLRNHKMNYTYTLFNLKESIQDVIDKHESLALENKREILFQDDGCESYISSDEFRFKQIIANVLSNAIKYGSSVVDVFLLCDKEKIEIIIEDDGKGISDKKGVFELYAQNWGGITNMEKKGTGIGLNFVKLLCADLGFSYSIEDSLSLGGAKFILTKKLKD